MTHEQFLSLDVAQRCDAIWEWGFLVGRRKNGEHTHVLYALHGFYAEMVMRLADYEVVDVLPMKELQSKAESSYEILAKSPFLTAKT